MFQFLDDEVVVRSDGVGVDTDESTDISDNVVLRVTRPGDGYFTAPSSVQGGGETPAAPVNCSTFLIFGIMMGCLLIVASVMMCLLAYRLNSMAAENKVANTIMPKRMSQCPNQLS